MKSVLASLGSSRGRVFVRRPSMKTLRLENSSQLNAEGHIEWGHDKPVGQAWAHRPLHLLGFSGLTRDFGETRVYVLVNGAYTLSVAKLWGIALCYWRLGQISTPTGTSLFIHQLCAVPALCTPMCIQHWIQCKLFLRAARGREQEVDGWWGWCSF